MKEKVLLRLAHMSLRLYVPADKKKHYVAPTRRPCTEGPARQIKKHYFHLRNKKLQFLKLSNKIEVVVCHKWYNPPPMQNCHLVNDL